MNPNFKIEVHLIDSRLLVFEGNHKDGFERLGQLIEKGMREGVVRIPHNEGVFVSHANAIKLIQIKN